MGGLVKPVNKMNAIQAIENLVGLIKVDYEKFNNGNNAAGTRVRKNALKLKEIMSELRKDVSEKKNAKKI